MQFENLQEEYALSRKGSKKDRILSVQIADSVLQEQ